jgi:hypothetical protein
MYCSVICLDTLKDTTNHFVRIESLEFEFRARRNNGRNIAELFDDVISFDSLSNFIIEDYKL